MYKLDYNHLDNLIDYTKLMGSFTKSFYEHPSFKYVPNASFSYMAAFGKVMERSFTKINETPEWNFEKGKGTLKITKKIILKSSFCNLTMFKINNSVKNKKNIFLIAPMSGHYSTLVKKTVLSLLKENNVYVTDWINPRDIPISEGKFDIYDYIFLLTKFFKVLPQKFHVFAVCQPAPLALVATALAYKNKSEKKPSSLTLLGGPIAPDNSPTTVSNFSKIINNYLIDNLLTVTVSKKYKGFNRNVYPGVFQLSSFISMNLSKHFSSFNKQILNEIRNNNNAINKHNKFYDEYLAVMDLTKEFFSSTIEQIFQLKNIKENNFSINGDHINLKTIDKTPIFVIEGEKDDIAAPGQCSYVFKILTKLNKDLKYIHIQKDAGHYGIFSGKAWDKSIRPKLQSFINKFS